MKANKIENNPEKEFSSTREKAMLWWGLLKSNIKLDYWRNYQKTTFTPSHSPDELTGREIEMIYNKEVLEPKRQEEWQESQVNSRYSKPNAKEFKQFYESLFKAYIDKFSKEDLQKASKILNDKILSDIFDVK